MRHLDTALPPARMRTIVLYCGLLFLCSSLAVADDWPMRGGSPWRRSYAEAQGPEQWENESLQIHSSAEDTDTNLRPGFVKWSQGGLSVTERFAYAAGLSGNVYCIDKRDGQIQWVHDCQSGVIGTPLVVGDRVYVATEDGDIHILSASETYEVINLVWHLECFESSPVFANTTLYLVSRNRIFAIGLAD